MTLTGNVLIPVGNLGCKVQCCLFRPKHAGAGIKSKPAHLRIYVLRESPIARHYFTPKHLLQPHRNGIVSWYPTGSQPERVSVDRFHPVRTQTGSVSIVGL